MLEDWMRAADELERAYDEAAKTVPRGASGMVVLATFFRLSIACLLMLAAWPAMAWPTFSLEAGPSFIGGYYSIRDSTASAFVEAVFDAHRIGSSDFHWAPDAVLGWIDGRNRPHTVFRRYMVHDRIWMLAGGVRFTYGADNAWYRHLFFSFQPTVHTGLTPGMSSWYEFTFTAGWQARHWLLAVRHSSNAWLRMPNRGEDMLLVGITF